MARLFQSPGIDNCIVTMIGFKAKINPEIILDELKQNVSKHPRFCSKLVITTIYTPIVPSFTYDLTLCLVSIV